MDCACSAVFVCGSASLLLWLVTIMQAAAACSKMLSSACLDKQPQAPTNAVIASKLPNSATLPPLLLLLLLLIARPPTVSAQGLWALPICVRAHAYAHGERTR